MYIYICVAPILECILYIDIYIFIIHVCVIKIYLRTISTCHPCVALKPTFCFETPILKPWHLKRMKCKYYC